MDLTTTYLGMKLRSPLVPSASPLTTDISAVRKMEDMGASAVVLHSLFEEQLETERREFNRHLSNATDSFAEATSFFPEPTAYRLGPEEYLDLVRKAKETVKVPVIASLNGTSIGGWTDFSRQMEQAGADALELNIYSIPTDASKTAVEIEDAYLEILKAVKSVVKVPVAVKLSPFFSNLTNMAKRLDDAGADGFVLFNRFYQSDIDLEVLEVRPRVLLSTPQAMRLPLRWIAILYGRVRPDLAATSGIYKAEDVVKMLMAGAKVTMMCSALLQYGVGHIRKVEQDLAKWLSEHEYDSVKQLQGSMSQANCPDPAAFERAQYIKTLQSFKL